MIRLQIFYLVVGLFVRLCVSQASGWIPNQVNTTMCYWTTPRAAVIRDAIYLDGGDLWWQPGMADGSFGGLIDDGNPLGLVYVLNFSTAFNTSQNLSAIFTTISKAPNGGEANNIGPQYLDGAMLANDDEWFTYGGLVSSTDAFSPPSESSVAKYELYSYGAPKQFTQGFVLGDLPSGITRYVTNGAAVSVPSENLGFYFGGLRSATWSPIYFPPSPTNSTQNADTLSTTLISLDMSVQRQEVWHNDTLPPSVPGRVNAEIVWVPVSKQGVLIAIGGVIDASFEYANQSDSASQIAESQTQSPEFLATVAVYDIANQVWYEQETSNPPTTGMTQGCTIVASAQDGSSHNIYWYGGYDGLHPAAPFSDDVWVLSIPSFVWVKVKSGTPSHARAGHRCTKPYPDAMFVIGGYASLSGATPSCVEDGIIQIFNLTTNDWVDSYDPRFWGNYEVPSAVVEKIGGSGTGSATQITPTASGFSNTSMTALFGTAYNSSKITTWYPYAASTTAATNRTTLLPPVVQQKSGVPSYLAPVLAVILGLFFITLLVVGILLWRRRRIWKMNGTASQSEAGTLDNRRWVTSWLRGTPPDVKAPTVTTDETPMTPYDDEPVYIVPEMAGIQVHEMMDTSRPSELHDTGTGFTPLALKQPSAISPGLAPSNSVTSHTSSVSRVSGASGSRPGLSVVNTPRAGSPFLGDDRITSDVSGVSESDRGHLRGISETSAVSTDGDYVKPVEDPNQAGLGITSTPPSIAAVPAPERPTAVSPLTPPSGTDGEAGDYLGAGAQQGSPNLSQRRKSNFSEGLEESEKK